MRLRKLKRAFYLRPTKRVARELVGKYLVRRVGGKRILGRIVEVEAYLGEIDPASHAYRGRTKRNDVMFWEGGYLYVYFTYGMHFCCNIVTEERDRGRAVLLRAVEPVAGLALMMSNRKRSSRTSLHQIDLCSGPARLCQAFSIDRADNGEDLCSDRIWIAEDIDADDRQAIAVSTRIGIVRGTERRLRYYLRGNPFVSKGKPA